MGWQFDAFLSFQRRDENGIVAALARRLRRRGVRCDLIESKLQRKNRLLSVELSERMAMSRRIVAVSTEDYDTSIFTFHEWRAALHERVLIIADYGGSMRPPNDANVPIVEMTPNCRKCVDRLAELLLTPLPRAIAKARRETAERAVAQRREADRQLRPPIRAFNAALRAGDLPTAFDCLRQRIFPPLRYKFGDDLAAAALLSEFELHAKPDPTFFRSKVSGSVPRLLTGSTLSARSTPDEEHPAAWFHTARGVAYRSTWDIARARESFEAACRIYRRSGDRTGTVANMINLADVAWDSGEIDRCCGLLEDALEVLREAPNVELKTILHQDLILRTTFAGRFSDADRHRRIAVTLAKGKDERMAIIHAACARHFLLRVRFDRAGRGAVVNHRTSRFAQGVLEHARLCSELTPEYPLRRNVVRAAWLIGAAHLALGKHSEAEAALSDALAKCRRIGVVEFEGDILLSSARWALETGRISVAAAYTHEALRLATATRRRLQCDDAGVLDSAIIVGNGREGEIRRLRERIRPQLRRSSSGRVHFVAAAELRSLLGIE